MRIGTIAAVVTLLLAIPAIRLAKWTAWKDFRAECFLDLVTISSSAEMRLKVQRGD